MESRSQITFIPVDLVSHQLSIFLLYPYYTTSFTDNHPSVVLIKGKAWTIGTKGTDSHGSGKVKIGKRDRKDERP